MEEDESTSNDYADYHGGIVMLEKIKDIVMSVFSIAVKVVIVIVASMFIYKYALIAFDYGHRIFSEEPMSTGEGRKVSVTIGSDMSVSNIGQLLENKGLIRDAKLFVLQERLSECHDKIQPGEYELTTAMTAEEMMVIMSDGYVEMYPEEEDTMMSSLGQDADDEFGLELMEEDTSSEGTAAIEGYMPVEEGAE